MPGSRTETKKPAPGLILFDLDGTLADTGPDLADALNRLLEECDRPPLPYATIRPVVSMGGAALISLAFQIDDSRSEFEGLRRRFLDFYLEDIARHTQLFPGMETVLERIETTSRHWGIVTNKPAWLTDPLMQALAMTRRARCIVSGDTLPFRKPHPEPLLHACRVAGYRPRDAIYVGDARRDVEAAHAAGIPAYVARYGYIPSDDDPGGWGAEALIDSPMELLQMME
ncbi:MAG: phosphoglycolate phosphatase [Gammaproteobacteria bacterium]